MRGLCGNYFVDFEVIFDVFLHFSLDNLLVITSLVFFIIFIQHNYVKEV